MPGADDYRYAGHPQGEEIASVYVTAALRQVEARWWLDRRGLAKRVLNHRDLVEDAGVARQQHGSLLTTVEAVMTDDERGRVVELSASGSVRAGRREGA